MAMNITDLSKLSPPLTAAGKNETILGGTIMLLFTYTSSEVPGSNQNGAVLFY